MSGALDTAAQRVGLWDTAHEEGGGLMIRVDEADLADLADVVTAAKRIDGLKVLIGDVEARIAAAVAEEREACAKAAVEAITHRQQSTDQCRAEVGAAIRARGSR